MFFFFNDTATTEIYTLSLHDALPISDLLRVHPAQRGRRLRRGQLQGPLRVDRGRPDPPRRAQGRGGGVIHLRRDGPADSLRDRKSTRLNSSHANISYAVFCLKKKITQ